MVFALESGFSEYRIDRDEFDDSAVAMLPPHHLVVVGFEMVRAFEGTTGHLSLRLMAALDAGQAAGGDKRGKQSAAMLIVKKDGGVWLHNDVVLRLQVDDNPEPLSELRRLVEMNARRFRPRH